MPSCWDCTEECFGPQAATARSGFRVSIGVGAELIDQGEADHRSRSISQSSTSRSGKTGPSRVRTFAKTRLTYLPTATTLTTSGTLVMTGSRLPRRATNTTRSSMPTMIGRWPRARTNGDDGGSVSSSFDSGVETLVELILRKTPWRRPTCAALRPTPNGYEGLRAVRTAGPRLSQYASPQDSPQAASGNASAMSFAHLKRG